MKDIILNSLYKSFGDNKIFEDFGYTFKNGSIVCIMGKSGCGKTTLLNLIMGLVTPDKGEISGVPNRISAVFQEDRLCETFSAIGNIVAVTGNNVSRDEILNCLDELGLSGSEDMPVSNLSGGMKRRVAIARALLAESELIVLDEPFKGLDEHLHESVIKTILSRAKGKTLIVATHDERDALLLGAEVLNI